MKIELHISRQASCPLPAIPDMMLWIECALARAAFTKDAQVSLRIVEEEAIRQLNLRYRGYDKPTNVLAFAAELPAELKHPLLGDIVICAPIVAQEAHQQAKTLDAHWAHMLVHGILHLLGYDHLSEAEAYLMETLETDILSELVFPPPYAVCSEEQPSTKEEH